MRSWYIILAYLCLLAGNLQAQDATIYTGHIAFIGTDGNVYLFDPNSSQPVPLTTDATVTPSLARLYEWPTWSVDGRLAYFETTVEDNNLNLDVHISSDGRTPGDIRYSVENTAFTYAAWSPGSCMDADRCRDLAMLLSPAGADGFAVRLLRDVTPDETASITEIGTGAPFYFSWSPDGLRMVWQRNNARVDIYDVMDTAISSTLTRQSGQFFAPAWSSVDDRVLYGAANPQGTTDLTIAVPVDSNSQVGRITVPGLNGPISFAWSPDGNHIAYTDATGSLTVIDAVTDQAITRTIPGVGAFFWSPDSQALALVMMEQQPALFNVKPAQRIMQENGQLQWAVLNVPTDSLQSYSTFIPTRQMAYLLTYFDQFASSHRVWSPDSRHLIYAEQLSTAESVIAVLDVTNTASIPLAIAEGVIGIWSFE